MKNHSKPCARWSARDGGRSLNQSLNVFRVASVRRTALVIAGVFTVLSANLAVAQSGYEVLAQQFAPVLRFDVEQQGYPMSAQLYFDNMLCGANGGPTSVCDPMDADSPCDPDSAGGAKLIQAACATQPIPYSPTSFDDLANTPTYYSATACGVGQVRIRYWFFYGHQPSCGFTDGEVDIPTPWGDVSVDILDAQGAHIADWEHVDVVLSIDQSQVAAVKFAQHNGWYTRVAASGEPYFGQGRGFEVDADGRPIIYVGRSAHGSYYNANESGVSACIYFDDNRRPGPGTDWNTGDSPLIDLTGSAEAWFTADRTATWNWGYTSVGTHPTKKDRLASCIVEMCKGLGGISIPTSLIPGVSDDIPIPLFQQFADSGCWASNCPTGMCGGEGPAVYEPRVSAVVCAPWPFDDECVDVTSFIEDVLAFIFDNVLGSALDLIADIPVLGDLVTGIEAIVQQYLLFKKPDINCGNTDVFHQSINLGFASGSLTAAACSSDIAFKNAFFIPTGDVGVLEPGRPNSPPVPIAGADYALECTSPGGTHAGLNGSQSYDPTGDPLTYTWTGPFSEGGGVISGIEAVVTLPLGENEITLTVSDGDFSATDTIIVAIWDTTQPDIQTLTANPATMWPPNHKLHEVIATPTVTDICDAAPVCVISGITSNEDDNGSGDGNTEVDTAITGPLTALLRAERSGNGAGRVYELTVQCTDTSSNTSTAVVDVSVEHDRRARR